MKHKIPIRELDINVEKMKHEIDMFKRPHIYEVNGGFQLEGTLYDCLRDAIAAAGDEYTFIPFRD